MHRAPFRAAARAGLLAGMLILASTLLAHKPVTTRYAFSRDVAPILERRCAPCHRPGGSAPMSLRTFVEARPWAESIKEEAIEASMPPLFAEPGLEPLLGEPTFTAREIDVLADWASGGAPAGAPRATPAPAQAPAASAALAGLEEREYGLGASTEAHENTVDLALAEDRFLAAWRVDGVGLRGAELRLGVEPAGSWTAGPGAFEWPRGAAQRVRAGSRATVVLVRWSARARKTGGPAGPVLRLGLLKAPPRFVVSPSRLEGATLIGFAPAPGDGGALSLAKTPESRVLARVRTSPRAWPVTYLFRDPVVAGGAEVVWESAGASQDAGPKPVTLFWLFPR